MFPVGQKWIILSPWEAQPPKDRLPLIIKKGAFGSGEHETTMSCLEELEKLEDLRDKKVLELGCGTGILALAAAKLGAREVVAVDIDPKAVKLSRENAQLNGQAVDVIQGSLGDAPGRFHLIMANIHGDILMDMAPKMVKKLLPGGYLLLSGVAYHENYQVLLTYKGLGMKTLKNRFLEEYTTLLMKKSSIPVRSNRTCKTAWCSCPFPL